MSETIDCSGACLCGSVKVEVKGAKKDMGTCHCNMCRKWGGGPLFAVECGTEVTLSGEDSVSIYDSSDWAVRGFCKSCGTHLFYRLKESGQYHMSLGIFENANEFSFHHQIFIDEKPAYFDFANETLKLTGAEVFAQATQQE